MAGLLDETSSGDRDKDVGTNTSNSASTSIGLPKGVVLGKDGKPCRTCTSTSAWLSMMKQSDKKTSSTNNTTTTTTNNYNTTQAVTLDNDLNTTLSPSLLPPQQQQQGTECPPDVEELGRSTWTLLHSLTATYPPNPSPGMQSTTKQFISLFSQLYPCWSCAEDFRSWMAQPDNHIEESLRSQEKFGRWMCRAHNEVNRKLGKREFDCDLWRERWKDGWKDGRCG